MKIFKVLFSNEDEENVVYNIFLNEEEANKCVEAFNNLDGYDSWIEESGLVEKFDKDEFERTFLD